MFSLGKEADALLRARGSAALYLIIPPNLVKQVVARSCPKARACTRVPSEFMVYFVLALGFFSEDCYRQLFRWLNAWTSKGAVPGRSTLCEGRHRLALRPLVRLGRAVVKLLGKARTPGVFYRGMRLMALDGFVMDVPDTPDNAKTFGRPNGGRTAGAFPQVRIVALCEAGTHVLWRWVIKPICYGEQMMADRLLRWLEPGMLLMWDRGFLSYSRVQQVMQRGTHLLVRVKSNLRLEPIRTLPDGSYLAKLYRYHHDRKRDRNGIVVRVMRYTLKDPRRAGHKQVHRLITTLLDPKLDPAKTLVELYHARWEEELSIDELKTHEGRAVLRSQTPAGVLQEVHGLLLAHFVVRALMFEASHEAQVAPASISFVGALKILRCRIPCCPHSRAGGRRWWRDLVSEVSEEVLPPRRNRVNPRVIKRKMSKWPKKRDEHRNTPQPVRKFADTILMLR